MVKVYDFSRFCQQKSENAQKNSFFHGFGTKTGLVIG